jgi:hypothetical protein
MSFKLKITFTGILEFVPDKAFNLHPTTVYVLAPNGEVPDPTNPPHGADGNELSRHTAFLRMDAKHIVGSSGIPSSLQAIWYLGNRDFRIKWHGAAQNLTIGDLSGLPSLIDVAPAFSKVDPSAVSGSTPPGKLGTRFTLTAGTLNSGKRQGKWVFPNIISKYPVRVQDMSNEVILELAALDSVSIIGKPLAGGDDVSLDLTAQDGETIEVTIGNLCDTNPLEWPDLYDRKPDEDFRWHFELLSPKDYADLATLVNGFFLPFPYPVGEPNAQGANCFPAAYAPLG